MARYQVHLITNLANFEGSISVVAGLVVTREWGACRAARGDLVTHDQLLVTIHGLR